jgi:hypothetical protein
VDDYAVGSAAGAGGAVNWPLFKWAGGGEDKCASLCGAHVNSPCFAASVEPGCLVSHVSMREVLCIVVADAAAPKGWSRGT